MRCWRSSVPYRSYFPRPRPFYAHLWRAGVRGDWRYHAS